MKFHPLTCPGYSWCEDRELVTQNGKFVCQCGRWTQDDGLLHEFKPDKLEDTDLSLSFFAEKVVGETVYLLVYKYSKAKRKERIEIHKALGEVTVKERSFQVKDWDELTALLKTAIAGFEEYVAAEEFKN